MDTGTHVVMGFGLAGLSALDPIVTQHSLTSEAVLFGVVFGSVIPDIDTVLKLKDNATYIRHHRGLTHSLPATVLWPILITAVLSLIFPSAELIHLWLWTFFAVFLHVFVDIFNAYGTQALRPLTYKWVALGMISIFDPIIFGAQIIGFILWYFIGYPGETFLVINVALIGYYFLRAYHHRRAVSIIRRQLHDVTSIYLSPTLRWTQYHVAIKGKTYDYVGEVGRQHFVIIDRFEHVPIPNHPAVEAAKKDKNIATFLSFSPIYRFEFEELESHYEVRFFDLRYLTNGHYPFVAIARISKDLDVLSSYTGWIYNKNKLEKKLSMADDYVHP